MTENGELLLKALIETSRRYPLLPGLVYRSPYDFVATHGAEHLVTGPYTGNPGLPRTCYGNAMVRAVLEQMRYVEGFTLAPTGKVILHAWNLDASGAVQDSTWLNTGLAYIGVEFSAARADDALWNGEACILNDEHRNYPIFRQPWTGEDYTLVWPHSDRLEALRHRDYSLAASVHQWIAKDI